MFFLTCQGRTKVGDIFFKEIQLQSTFEEVQSDNLCVYQILESSDNVKASVRETALQSIGKYP